MPARILRHLNEDGVTGLESGLDTTRLALHTDGVPVDLAGVQDGVAATTHVDERRFHRRKDVLDAAQVDVADHRGLRAARDVVLDKQAVFENGDLVKAVLVADDHRALDGLAACQELRLGDRVAATSLTPSFAATHLLCLEARGALQGLHLVGGISPLIRGRGGRTGATTAATTGRGLLIIRGVRFVGGSTLLVCAILSGGRGFLRFLGATAATGLRLGGSFLSLFLGGGSLRDIRSLVRSLLGATAALGSRFLSRSIFFYGGGLTTALRLGLVLNDGRRGNLGGSLENGCLEQQRGGGRHGGRFGCHDSPMVGARPVPGRTLFHRPQGAET